MPRAQLLRLLEVVVVLALAGSALAQVHATEAARWQGGRAVHDVLALAMALPLLARRRHAVVVLAAVVGSTWVQYELGGGLGQPFFAVLVALYSVGAHASAPATYVGPGVVAAMALGVDLPRLRDGAPWDDVVPAWFVLVGVWALGRWVRHRRVEASTLAQRAEMALRDADRSREAVAEERARIARELHDLVAHSMGVIVLQAQGAQRTLDIEPERTRTALTDIEDAGRNGLAEMRRLVGLLTEPPVAATAEPQPSLAQLRELVERVSAAGTPVDLDVQGDVRGLAPGVELTAYRVVQEALTNALKHAPGAPVSVHVAYGDDAVEVSVSDSGTESERPLLEHADVGGHGMVGMRERVALYGGELVAGPRAEGGFAVLARLPVGGGT